MEAVERAETDLWLRGDASGALRRAVAEYRRGPRQLACPICDLYELGDAYQRAGLPDSAVAVYQRYLTTPWLNRLGSDAQYLARVLRRLGELHEGRGDRARALEYYSRFVELWKDADPELQTAVREVRDRMAGLAGERLP